MTTKQRKKRAGLTARSVRRDGSTVQPVDGTQLTPARRTRRYSPRARKCARKGCSNVFTPRAKHGRFCSDNCRRADARRREQKVTTTTVKRDLVQAVCLYCGGSFLPEAGRGAKYCSDFA